MSSPSDTIPRQDQTEFLASEIEQETKLMVDDSFRLPPLRGRTLPRRVFTSTYYDTADHCLARAHITLRYRLEGRLGLWQLKLPLNGSRREVELRGEETRVPSVLRDALIVHLEGKSLVPISNLRTWRTGVRVPLGGGTEADVVLDSVSVLKGGQLVERFRELEIEWLRANASQGDHLTRMLRKAGARPHDGRPKLFRALSLAYDHPGPPPADAPVRDHIQYALTNYVQALRRFDPGTRLGGEPEDLHQMRVTIRRLRAVLRSAHRLLDADWADPLISGLTWLGRLFGNGRDLDVQIDYFRREASILPVRDRRPIDRFVSSLQEKRSAFQRLLVDEMRSAHYQSFLSKLQFDAHEARVVERKTETLKNVAARQFKKLCKVMRRVPKKPSNEELHRVRIKAKRARYAAELAAPCVGKGATRFAKAAKAFQDLLGVHQDAVLAEQYVRAFLKRSPGDRASFVGGLLVARAHRRREEVREKYRSIWKRVRKRGKKVWC